MSNKYIYCNHELLTSLACPEVAKGSRPLLNTPSVTELLAAGWVTALILGMVFTPAESGSPQTSS